jgi:ATP-dependent Clp protease protease subunit
MSANNQHARREYVLSFFGPMRQPATTALRNCCCQAVNEGYTGITVLFSSDGGSTEDGLALYEFLRTLPIPLRMHAVGLVASIAIPVFLAADVRTGASSSCFLFHGYTWTYADRQTLSVDMMAEHSSLIGSAVERAKRIIETRTQQSHTPAELEELFAKPRIVDATYATQRRLVEGIEEFRVPAGAVLLNAVY